MKKAEEYLFNRLQPFYRTDLIDIIKQAQEDAIRETVKEFHKERRLLIKAPYGKPYNTLSYNIWIHNKC